MARSQRGGAAAELTGPARNAVLAATRKFAASPDVQDEALALYVNAQVCDTTTS